MSAVLGIFGPDDRLPGGGAVRVMLEHMRGRGRERSEIWHDRGVLLAVARNEWELSRDFSGPALIVQERGLVVAADASIYYCADLRRKLRAAGVDGTAPTPSHLILAAYQAWGAECAGYLEGDFAFIIWDRHRGRVVCARDGSGKRPLYYAEPRGSLVVASTSEAVAAHPDCSTDLNLVAIAETAAGLTGAGDESCYRAVSALPAGSLLLRDEARPARISRHWAPPEVDPGRPLPFDTAAEELRALLVRAVDERIATAGPTSVWLGDGLDAATIFGAAQRAVDAGGGWRTVRPVAIGASADDSSHEDPFSASVAAYWEVPITWLAVDRLGVFDRPAERAAVRAEPFAHPFEIRSRMLARGSRSVGARVALDGNGGDRLFQVSHVYLADLLARGRWYALAREWRAKNLNGTGIRCFFDLAVQPLLPAKLLRLVRAVGGKTSAHYLERRLPAWIERSFARRHALNDRERLHLPHAAVGRQAAGERAWYLSNPYFPRVVSSLFELTLEEGLELRSPLYDRRIIEFAASRPRWECASGAETKRLLRHAARGLLPEKALTPDQLYAGTAGASFERSMRAELPWVVSEIFHSSALVDLGVVDPAALRRAASDYVSGADASVGVALLYTVQTELWLKARLARSRGEPDTPAPGGGLLATR